MNYKRVVFIVAGIIILCTLSILTFLFLLAPVSNDIEEKVFEVSPGSTLDKIAENLEDEGLIKSDLAFKIYLRVKSISNFQSGEYTLSPSMTPEEIALKLQRGEVSKLNQVKVTFPEGSTLDEIAKKLSDAVEYPAEDIIEKWNDPKFVDKAIKRFDFISPVIKNKAIPYPLNGYLFPDTYYFSTKDFDPEDAAWVMLSKMEEVIKKHKDLFKKSEYSPHEILTLASIIEYEANNDKDRYDIAGVFTNRLKANMFLGSCATLAMATGEHKLVYSYEDTQVDSPYNTYKNLGLPIAPGNNPGEASIKAALNPSNHDYYYFLADVYGDSTTYYSKTLEEHNKLKDKYLR